MLEAGPPGGRTPLPWACTSQRQGAAPHSAVARRAGVRAVEARRCRRTRPSDHPCQVGGGALDSPQRHSPACNTPTCVHATLPHACMCLHVAYAVMGGKGILTARTLARGAMHLAYRYGQPPAARRRHGVLRRNRAVSPTTASKLPASSPSPLCHRRSGGVSCQLDSQAVHATNGRHAHSGSCVHPLPRPCPTQTNPNQPACVNAAFPPHPPV